MWEKRNENEDGMVLEGLAAEHYKTSVKRCTNGTVAMGVNLWADKLLIVKYAIVTSQSHRD